MASDINSLLVSISADIGDLQSKLAQAGSSVSDFGTAAQGSADQASGAFGKLGELVSQAFEGISSTGGEASSMLSAFGDAAESRLGPVGAAVAGIGAAADAVFSTGRTFRHTFND